MTLNHLSRCKAVLSFSALLGITLLFVPIVWMEIGPLGIAYYGPEVPDIYIYGGFISGKDLNWTGISFAMIFQVVMIVAGIFFEVISLVILPHNRNASQAWHGISTALLLLFPLWMYMYANGVIHNSDGAAADLTVHYEFGLGIYAVLLMLNISGHVLLNTKKTP